MDSRQRKSGPLLWFKKRTLLERRLIIASGIVSIFALALIIAIVVQSHKLIQTNRSANEICTTPGCIQAASSVLEYIDLEADPCEDFYQFACGGFLKQPIPDDQITISSFSKIQTSVTERLKLLLEEPMEKNAPKPYHLFHKLYNMCKNKTAIEESGLINAKHWIQELGGWPVLEGGNWREDQFDWKKFAYKSRKLGVVGHSILGFGVTVDFKNSSRYVIRLGEAFLPVPRAIILSVIDNKPFLNAYLEYYIDMAMIFGADRTRATRELEDVTNLIKKIAEFSTPVEEMVNVEDRYNPMTIKELQVKYPRVPWMEYIRNMLGIPSIRITESEVVIVSSPKFLTELLYVLETTPKRTLANLLVIMSVDAMGPYLTEQVRDRQFKIHKILGGVSEKQPRSTKCLNLVSASLPVGSMYVRKYFDEESKKDVEEIISDIRTVFAKIIRELDWMDETTKKNALEKLEAITIQVGYPDELLDDHLIERYYEKLDFSTNNYLDAVIKEDLFSKEKAIAKLRKSTKEELWTRSMIPTFVNAIYMRSESTAVISAAFLQDLFFAKDRPKYMNYGSVGSTLGHELTHGFDSNGRRFDKNGNMHDWWEGDTAEAYQKKVQCIIDQYSNYTVPEIGLNVNGIATQDENIADNGAIIQGYMAYQAWTERNAEEQKLPGLQNFTPHQMFWISAARVECAKKRKDALKTSIISGYAHSPAMFRVIGPFSNSEYFSKDFNCKMGSVMNP